MIVENHCPRVWTRERSGSVANKRGANSLRARDPCAGDSRTVEEGWLWMRRALARPGTDDRLFRVNSRKTAHACKLELQTGLPHSMQSPYERVCERVVEVNGVDPFLFRPSGKSSRNGSLLAKRPLCVTSAAKVLKEWFYLIIKQALLCPAGAGRGHEASPCDGMLPVGRGDTIMPRPGPSKTRLNVREARAHGIIRQAA